LTNERLTTLNDRLEKINWNLGLIAKPKKWSLLLREILMRLGVDAVKKY
jgi:hypothetical protein